LIALFHAKGVIDAEVHEANAVIIDGRLPALELHRFKPFRVTAPTGRSAPPAKES
jgi:hypothetical protein